MIKRNVKKMLKELLPGVTLVAAAKSHTPQEIFQAMGAGVKAMGENCVQKAGLAFSLISKVKWHMTGHLQRNSKISDMVETLDSLSLAQEIGKRRQGREIPVLIEVNSGRDEDVSDFAREVAKFAYIKVQGLMAMAPELGEG